MNWKYPCIFLSAIYCAHGGALVSCYVKKKNTILEKIFEFEGDSIQRILKWVRSTIIEKFASGAKVKVE